jgi:hypothetical protein
MRKNSCLLRNQNRHPQKKQTQEKMERRMRNLRPPTHHHTIPTTTNTVPRG